MDRRGGAPPARPRDYPAPRRLGQGQPPMAGLRRGEAAGVRVCQARDGVLHGPLLALNQTRIGDFKRGYLYPLGIIGAFAGLILVEPDFGTAALALSVGLILLFLAGAKWRYILPTIGLSAAAFAVLVAHNPNRLRRFTAFLDVEGNRQGGTYQLDR